MSIRPDRAGALVLTACLLPLAACTPRIALEAPKEPITINLNVKIDHEIRLRVEQDIDELFSDDSALF
ncbi:hypothetical protein A167_03355 [Alcanivorax sp. S71-1-4]|jgi:hypothetical protein|uniref:YnbE family lipoprotein n=1 Tax=Alcanivorax sp. S71-1-4 TaxID=1177159 RepID=UPI001357DEDF|nr:YnbE family lipoprotein [Alcanivorax sp. S71-1-4]KAF0805968.1 hypothetical protein A167_03355 [Alcanivorax sp. S71-1-4]